jgi:hypothetical protein
MKKFYSVLLAGVVGVSTMVAAPKAQLHKAEMFQLLDASALVRDNLPSNNMRKAAVVKSPLSEEDLAGKWDFSSYSELSSGSGQIETQTVELVQDEASMTAKYYLTGLYGSYSIVCNYDETTGQFSIPVHQEVFYASNYSETAYFEHYVWEEYTASDGSTKYKPVKSSDPIIGTCDGDKITFDPYDAFGISISKGYFLLVDEVSMQKQAPDVWVNVDGNATVVDAWFMPGWEFSTEGVTYYDYPFECAVQNNQTRPVEYRLVNPYAGSYFTSENQDKTAAGYIQFDFSDPALVVIKPGVYTGLTVTIGEGTSAANYMIYANSEAGYYYYNGNFTKDQVKSIAAGDYNSGDNDYSFTPSTYDSETKQIVISDAYFGFKQGATDKSTSMYTWLDEGPMSGIINLSKVNFAGVTDVTVDNNNNAPVEYFNLQGVRVNNPSNGLYIRRQGTQTSKVLLK